MKLIAIEEHFGFGEIGAAGNAETERLCPYFHDSYANAYPLPHVPVPGTMQDLGEGRIKDMDEHDIAIQIVSSNSTQLIVDEKEAIEVCKNANDKLYSIISAYPDRLLGYTSLPTINPQAAADELERCVKEYHFKGANLFGRTNEKFLDDPIFEPLLAKAEELDVPLYLHPGFPSEKVTEACYKGFSDMVTTRFACSAWGWHADAGVQVIRMILAGVFDRHPNLTIISGHWGEFVPFYLERLDTALPPEITKLKQKISDYFQTNIYITPSGMLNQDQLDYCVKTVGIDRIMFSADYPFITNDGAQEFVEKANLSQEDKEKFAYKNAMKVFKIDNL